MRYYALEFASPTGSPILQADGSQFGPFTSFVNGINQPSALNVEWDIPVTTYDLPISSAWVRIWGIGLPAMYQAANFNNGTVNVYGGMQKGLPLANPKQNGKLLVGTIFQAYGNWQGTDQTLDFQIVVPSGTAADPANIVFDWKQGQNMADAVVLALQSAFPSAVIENLTTQQIVLPYDPQCHAAQNLAQFSQYVADTSSTIVGGNYLGIKIVPTQNGFRLFDGTNATTPKQLAFTDLIGQPTWLDLYTISVKVVMRADIAVGDFIQMPPTPFISTPQSFSQYRKRATFSGSFAVLSVRHMGHFRQQSADSWVTVIEAVSVQ